MELSTDNVGGILFMMGMKGKGKNGAIPADCVGGIFSVMGMKEGKEWSYFS